MTLRHREHKLAHEEILSGVFRMLERWNQWVLANPWKIVFISLVLTVLAGSGLAGFQPNNDPRIFFTEDNPDYKRFRILEDRFTSNEIVLFIINPASGEVFTRETLTAIEELTEQAWTLPFSTRVDSLTNYQHTEVQGDDLFVNYLVENAQHYTDDELAKIRNIATNEPALINRLVSPEGHVAGVLVTVTMEEGNHEANEIAEAAQKMAAEFEQQYPEVEFMVTGSVVFSQASELATSQAMATTLPLALLAMIICLQLILRSVLFTFIVMFVVGISIATAIGVALWCGIEFSPIVGMAPSMILTLAVADCVHILSTYRHQRLIGDSVSAGIRESLRVNFQPVWLTSLTTAIGFAILNFSESQPFRALGNVVVFGVMAAFVFSVVLLPVLVKLIPHRIHKDSQVDYAPWMEQLSGFVVGRYRAILVVMSLVVIGLTACLSLLSINDVFNEYYDETFEVRRVNDFYTRELSGMHRIDYSIDSGVEGGTMNPQYLAGLDQLVNWLKQQDHVVYASSYANVIKRLNRDMHGGDDSYYRIPENQQLVSQYTLLYELSLPQGLGLDNELDLTKRYGRVVVVLENIGSAPVLEFNRKVENWIAANLPEQMHTKGTGMDVLFGSVTIRNIQSLLIGAFIALSSVSLLLILSLRSLRYGMLSLLPNLLPALMAFGLWGLLVGEIGLAVSIVACMTLGIVVDDTVHFLSKYVRAKRELGLTTNEAVRYAFRTVGVALIVTSIVLVANFGVIGTSHFYPNSSMGQLSAITIAMALVVDFFFFVPLLIAFDKRKQKRMAQEQDTV